MGTVLDVFLHKLPRGQSGAEKYSDSLLSLMSDSVACVSLHLLLLRRSLETIDLLAVD